MDKIKYCFIKFFKGGLVLFVVLFFNSNNVRSQSEKISNKEKMMIRIAEIEIDPTYLDDYLTILKEESEASVRLEPGVISIFPFYQKDKPAEIKILEIYANKSAYKSHLETTHFKKYKETTLNMVKTLKLIEMKTVDSAAMSSIFKKLK